MSKNCPLAKKYTKCTDNNCEACMSEESVYKITLAIYPIADCGKDLTKGEPLETSYEGNNLVILKRAIDWTIINTMKIHNANDGETFVEMDIEKDGKYFDHDEITAVVDLRHSSLRYVM